MAYPVISSPEEPSSKKQKWLIQKQKEEARNKAKSMKHKEYQKLKIMVPSIALKPNVSKVTVIEEAVRYIDHLHVALLTKLEEQDSASFRTGMAKGENKGSSYSDMPYRTGNAALELMKKADFSLYVKLKDQMEYFSSKDFIVSGDLKYIDGQYDVRSMAEAPMKLTK